MFSHLPLSLPVQSSPSYSKTSLKPTVNYFCLDWMSNSVINGLIWLGLSIPQGDKGGGFPNKKLSCEPNMGML